MSVEPRPIDELRGSGLLWLINASVFHPRGFALALCYTGSEVIGWKLLGDGTEPWQYEPAADDRFAAAEATFAEARTVGDDGISSSPDKPMLLAGIDVPIHRAETEDGHGE